MSEAFSFDNCTACEICYALVFDIHWGEHMKYHRARGDCDD